MKLNIRAFTGATAIVTAVVFTLCALAIALAPDAAYATFSFLFHTDLTNLAYPMGWSGYFGGLAIWVLGMGLVAAAGSWLYNRLNRG